MLLEQYNFQMKRSAYKSKVESIDPYITKIEFNHLISWFFDSNVNDINLNKFIALCRNKNLNFGSAMGCFLTFIQQNFLTCIH